MTESDEKRDGEYELFVFLCFDQFRVALLHRPLLSVNSDEKKDASVCIPRRSTESDKEESVGYGLLWMIGNTVTAVVGYSSDAGSMTPLE